MQKLLLTLTIILGPMAAPFISAQDTDSIYATPDSVHAGSIISIPDSVAMDSVKVLGTHEFEVDTTLDVRAMNFPNHFFGPVVFDRIQLLDSTSIFDINRTSNDTLIIDSRWATDAIARNQQLHRLKQNYMVKNPRMVTLNARWLPEPPKAYRAVVDPSQNKIIIEEITIDLETLRQEVAAVEMERRNWLRDFKGSLQFSQAYISPNWYQGGNNNLNMILNLIYDVKLNQAFHPNLLFETTFQYKLGMNSAPDDELRDYSISEDLFQISSKFGIKAAERWFYSLNATFKTQIFNGYKSNTYDLKAAFMSPGELNVGVGMTYEYINKPKTLTFNASVSPLSYNLKTCLNDRMDVTAFGIKEGHSTVSQYGSSGEAKMTWKITRDLTYTSRLFVFTDYNELQGDWENTFNFQFNRFLSTQIYVHARYDSATPRQPDNKWHKWQLKEILSFGFAYHFSTI